MHVCVLACVRSCARARVGMFYFCKYNYRYKLLTSLFLYFYVQVYCIVDVDVCCFQYKIPHVAVYGFDTNQPSLPTLFYSVFVSISVCMALSTVFHSIKSPRQLSAFSLCSSGLISALLVLSTVFISLYESLLQP